MTSDAVSWVDFPCLQVRQPIGTFYVGIMNSRDVVRLSYSDVRRIEGERRDVETYLGIERPLDRGRVADLRQYVRNVDATFPSPVILAAVLEDTRYDSQSGIFSIRDAPEVAKVLDGQHRIAGLEGYEQDDFQLIVTVFVDMDIEDQAMVFATINLEQTKVNKSLAYDLYEYTKARSPQKTAHNIVRLLDREEGSPFRRKVKILGTAGDPGETVSQAVFVDALLPLISKDPMSDRDLLKRGKEPPEPTPAEEQTLVFRRMFLHGRDADVALVIWNFFAAVERKWGDYWREARRGYVLNRTTGFRGLMQFLPRAYHYLGGPETVPSVEAFDELLQRVSLRAEDFTPENFPPGTSGQTKLRNMLLSQTSLS